MFYYVYHTYSFHKIMAIETPMVNGNNEKMEENVVFENNLSSIK